MCKAAVTVVLLATASCAPGEKSDETKTLASLELEWANAVERNDVKAIGSYLHPDFTFTSPTGQVANRKDHLEDFRNGNARFTLVALSEVEVRVYGKMAVVTSRATIDGSVKVDGRVITLKAQGARWTDSLVLQDGTWTCVARQQSNIPPPATSVRVALQQVLKEKLDGKETQLTLMELEYAPGAGTPPHSHSGPVAVYVLEGAIESQIEGGKLTTYRQGDAFFEPAHGKHLVSRNASQVMPARFLVYFLTPKGEPLTIGMPGRQTTAAPEYDGNGKLKLPADYRRWIFVGANLGLQYSKDAKEMTPREKNRHRDSKKGDFHNVYINPEAYEHYLKTGNFPDKTVLVMDVYEARERDAKGIVSGGYFPGKQLRIEAAVKNSKRPDGKKTDWAYYVFEDLEKPSPQCAFKDGDCYQCHKTHAAKDNVWVQFYPSLRGETKAGETGRLPRAPKLKVEEGKKKVNGTELYYKAKGTGDTIIVLYGGPGLDHTELLPNTSSSRGIIVSCSTISGRAANPMARSTNSR
jgi:quercetin dioxygenase-like cupin family protein/ketosteroid isomerase-like protein